MEHFNLIWFSKINAGANLHGFQLWLSIFAAKYLVFLIVLWLLGMWFWGSPKHRNTLILAFIASLVALAVNWGISLTWFHPRPFVLGIGHTYLMHAPDSSFPSDHFTALCAIFLIFLWQETIKSLTVLFLLFMTLCIAWARIYVGVHYPLDMLGGIVVAVLSAGAVIYLSTFIEQYLLPITENTYRRLFVKVIQKKWVNN